jgi:hypothetical protein
VEQLTVEISPTRILIHLNGHAAEKEIELCQFTEKQYIQCRTLADERMNAKMVPRAAESG